MRVFHSKHLWPTLILVCCTLVAVVSALNIEKNTSAFFLPADHPARVDHRAHQEAFTRTSYSSFILLKLKENTDIYHNHLVTTLERLHENINEIDLLRLVPREELQHQFSLQADVIYEKKSDFISLYNELNASQQSDALSKYLGQYLFPIKSIKSLINTDNIYEADDELIVESNYKVQTNWSEETKRQIANNDLLKGSLFSRNEQGLIVQVEFAIDEENTELNLALLKKIQLTVNAITEKHPLIESVHYAGGPVLNNALSDVMEKDNAAYFPLVILFVLTTLTLFFRSWLCAMYGLCISVLSILFTLALMPLLGVTLNIVTTILPVFIITIAVTDAIHVMSDVRHSSICSNQRAIKASIKKLLRPMFLTSITTGIGFLSLSLTEIDNIKDFGLMVAISVVIAFVLSVTLLPWLLGLKSIKPKIMKTKHSASEVQPGSSLNESALNNDSDKQGFYVNQFAEVATNKIWPALICLTCAIALTAVGLPKLKVDQASIEAFDSDSKLRIDNQAFIESGTGSVMLNIWLSRSTDGSILDADILNLIKSIQTNLQNHPMYVDSVSLVDFLDRTHTVLEGSDSVLDLHDRERVRQYLFLLEGGAERDLESIVGVGSYKETRIAVNLAQDNSAAALEIIDLVNSLVNASLVADLQLKYAGYAAITHGTADEVFSSQLNSLASSLLAILIVFIIVFRSITTAVVGMIPLTATLATMFGVMGVFGFPLDVGSSLVAGIAFGIGIDYAIHLLEAIRRSANHVDREDIIKNALKQVCVPISVSAVVLSSGFSLLLLSGFKSLASLGLLVMVSMIVSAVFSLLIVPQILKILPQTLFESVSQQSYSHDESDNELIWDETIQILDDDSFNRTSKPAIRLKNIDKISPQKEQY